MEHRSTGGADRRGEWSSPIVTKPTWGDLDYCLSRMQGKQMLPLGGYDDALGWVLTMATIRRATWRAGKSVNTKQIVAYFLEFKGIDRREGCRALWALANRYGHDGACTLIEELAGGKPG